ncbi:WD40-repeat-containing domain protein [Colletotrichum cereale]|nr:WD40-repeat-containing domain protein [Colletotrichum cereale]
MVRTTGAMGDSLKRPQPSLASGLDDRAGKRQATPDVVSRNTGSAFHTGPRSELHGTGIQHSGSGDFSAHKIYIGTTSDGDRDFLRDLRVTDPRDDKARIERTKGGLLRDSYHWVLDHDDFRRWRDEEQSRLLWIKGDPGKGKRCYSALETLPARTLSYFFCQAAEPHLNNATAVVRGLIYQILDRAPSLIGIVRKKYEHAGKSLFEDANSWDALSEMLFSILEEPSLENTYLVIDALDECESNLNQLLHLIVQLSTSSRAKLVVSSRNWPDIEDALADATQKIRLCLELNEQSISAAVDEYIQYKVDQLMRSKRYNCETRDAVKQHLMSNANDTFLWVALVCQELADPKVRRWHTRAKLLSFPSGLNALYARMMDRVFNSDDADICREVLCLVSITHRPLSLVELASLADSLEYYADDAGSLEEIVSTCGSLLTLREGFVYFVHQSVKDFLLNYESRIYPHGVARENRTIALKSIQVMSRTLRRDVYDLRAPGFPISQVKPLDPNPLAPAQYSCVYWAYHLADGETSGRDRDSGLVYEFLKQHYLHWLEALSLLDSISEGILQMVKLAHLPEVRHSRYYKPHYNLHKLTLDGLRFIRTHRASIENCPLQVYASALTFTPMRSIVRELFRHEEPTYLVVKPNMEDEWNACLQTLEGHTGNVESVAFSGDCTQLASSSDDRTIRVWDLTTGRCLQIFKGHTEVITSVTFSSNGKQLFSASHDRTIKAWDLTTGQCLHTLKGHTQAVSSVACSSNSLQLASASWDCTIKIWDPTTGQCLRTLKGHNYVITSVAFSSSSMQLASASRDYTIKIWDPTTGQCLQTLNGHSDVVASVAFSSNGIQLASASWDCTIKIWNPTTGQCLRTLQGHFSSVTSVAFSSNSMQLASASHDRNIKFWDTTGRCLQTLKGHAGGVASVAFSSNSIQLASASWDCTIKIWNPTTGQCLYTLKGHTQALTSVAFSSSSTQLASASYDRTVKVWDTAGRRLQTLRGHRSRVTLIAFSGDSTQLVSVSSDCTTKIWDATGQCLQTLRDRTGQVTSVAFSNDGTRLALASYNGIVRVWDTTGQCLQTLRGHRSRVISFAFSPTNTQLASASLDKTIKIWDGATDQCLQTIKTYSVVAGIYFSTSGAQLYTNTEVIDLESLCTTSTMQQQPRTVAAETPRSYSYEISADGVWITRNSVDLLWLPPDYRSRIWAVAGSTVAIGCETGRVLLFRFLQDEPGV